jgi:hypothetical protein
MDGVKGTRNSRGMANRFDYDGIAESWRLEPFAEKVCAAAR